MFVLRPSQIMQTLKTEDYSEISLLVLQGDTNIPSLLSSEVGGDNLDLETELSNFRSQWQQEIRSRSPRGQHGMTGTENDYILEKVFFLILIQAKLSRAQIELNMCNSKKKFWLFLFSFQAKVLFLKGSHLEQSGKLYEGKY